MSRKARNIIERVLAQNDGVATEEELVQAQVDERGVTEDTARDYVTMYCEKTEKADGTIECVAFGDTKSQQQKLAQKSTDSEGNDNEYQPVGNSTGDEFAELDVLGDVAHPQVPQEAETGYYRRRMAGHKSDVQVVTRALSKGYHVMLKGETGVGKGQLVRHIAANTNRPVYQANMGEEVRVEDLIGHYQLQDGETKWVDGILTRCVREGGIFQADEWNAIGGSVSIMLHALLEDDGVLTIPQTGETVAPHPEFRVVGTMNPNYAGTKKQNWASMNRFVPVELDYISKDREVQVVLDNTDLDDKQKHEVESLVEAANELREDYKNGVIITPVSTRELIKVGDYVADGFMDMEPAAKMIIGALADENDRNAVEKALEMNL